MQAHLFQRQCHNDQDSRLEDWLAQFPFLCHRHHDHRSVHLVVIASLTPSVLCDSGSYIFIKIHVVIIVSQIPWGFRHGTRLCAVQHYVCWVVKQRVCCGFDPAIWQRILQLYFLFFAVQITHFNA